MDCFYSHLRRKVALALLLTGICAFALPAHVPAARIARQRGPESPEVCRLDVLIVLYTRSFSHTLTREQLERVHEEVLEFVDFYRSAAGDAVDFRISLLQIDRELALAEVSEVAPGRYYLARENIRDELARLGMLDPEYDEVIALYAWNNANAEGAVLAYGGGAVGPDGTFLGDAGYNSIGVFAWDPGRISQIMIHEVLHNIDDMFSMSGMPDGFLNADEMSRNMPTLLAERPGAFLPQYDDNEMTSYAEREQANRATYPWAMQLVYYAWMLGRTPRELWLKLDYGRPAVSAAVHRPSPLYDRLFLSRANAELYLPIFAGGAVEPPEVRVGSRPAASGRLERRTYHHTDFDGSTIFQGDYFGGWLELPAEGERFAIAVGDAAATEVVRLRMGDLVAPSHIVSYGGSWAAEEASRHGPAAGRDDEGVLLAEVREARFGGGGPAVKDVMLEARIGEQKLNAEQLGPGHYAFELPELELGPHVLTLRADAAGFVFISRAVTIERRSAWRIWADSQMVAANGTPLDITIRIAQDVGARGARVTARVRDRQVALRELADGRYSGVLEEGLLPGLDTVRVRAELPGPAGNEVLDHAIPIYVEPRGWIEVPTRIDARAGEPVTLEARLRDRMGRVVRGAGLPIAVVAGAELLMMQEDITSGVYRVSFVPPEGDSRVYVIGLEGSYERRVVSLQVH